MISESHTFVSQQIVYGVYSLTPRRKGKSFIWNVISEILKEDDTVLQGFVYCRTCTKVLKYSGNQTSNLNRHKCCRDLKQPKVLQTITTADRQKVNDTCTEGIIEDCLPFSSINGSGFAKIVKVFIKIGANYGENVDVDDLLSAATTISPAAQELQTIKATDKKEVIDTCTEWITEDCRPYSSINGSGFEKIVKLFIKIGASYGENIDINDLLPHASTISRKAQKAADDKRAFISNEIKDVVNCGGASVTIDMWSDNYVNRNFVGVTMHYQKNFQLFDIVLGLESMDFEDTTGENILKKLTILFNQFGVENIDSIKFITNREEYIVKALKNHIHLTSSSHLLTNVLDKSFEETTELREIIQACKKIVKYFKKTNLQHKLSSLLKNPWPIRWNSNYTMLKSVLDNWDTVYEVLTETEETKGLLNIDVVALTNLVELCKNFDFIFKKMQTSSSPSLFFVLPSIHKIKTLCELNKGDIPTISILKKNMIKNIEELWFNNLTIWHKTAFFLFPPALNMQPRDLVTIKEFCISQIQALEKVANQSQSTSNQKTRPITTSNESFLLCSCEEPNCSNCSSTTLTHQLSAKQEIQFFFQCLFQESKKSPREEVEEYSSEIVDLTKDFDVIQWWKRNRKNYPLLSKFALQVHSIPASNAAAERAFSLASDIVTEQRNRLRPETLDSLLFLHSFYKKF